MEFDYSQQPGMCIYNRNLAKSGKPKVSIITAFYNSAKYFEQTFNCVMNQTFPWFEWIIVDDGSTDQIQVEMLNEYARRDPRIVVYHKENGGAADARDFGVSKATTAYILPLDADDLIEPSFIEYLWWALEKNPKAAWAYTDSVGFQDEEYVWTEAFDPIRLKTQNLLSVTALIRKKWFLDVGGFRIPGTKNFHEDWNFWLKIVAAGGYPVQITHEQLFWYRRTRSGRFGTVESNSEYAEKNKAIIEKTASQIQTIHEPVIFPNRFSYGWALPKLSDDIDCIFENKSKISVLFLLPWLEMGGADKFNLDLIKGLDKQKFDIGMLTTLNATNEWLSEFRGVTPDIFNLPNFMDCKDYAEFISYYIKSRKVDILFVSNSYHGYYLLPWLRENFPELVIVDYLHMEEWYWRGGGFARVAGMLSSVTERTYVCNSATKRVLEEKFDCAPDCIETVHIGVDIDKFKKENVAPGYIHRLLQLDEDRPVVLFICRFHPQKRPFLMLKIAEEVRKKVPDVAFVAVGGGEQETEMINYVNRNHLADTVYFVPAQKEVRPFYRDSKITLICSLKEGLSLTAYESCAMSVPVISADVGGQSDLIDNSVGMLIPCMQSEAKNLDARFFPQAELDAYVSAVIKLLTDNETWRRTSLNCRKKIENGFSITDMTTFFNNEFLRLLQDLALKSQRLKKAEAIRMLSPMAADYYSMEMQNETSENGFGFFVGEEYKRVVHDKSESVEPYQENKVWREIAWINERLNKIESNINKHEEIINRHEDVVCRHEEVVCRHEEVLCRHEEVVCRHEQVVNDDWWWLKNLEKRMKFFEHFSILGWIMSIGRKLKKIEGKKQ